MTLKQWNSLPPLSPQLSVTAYEQMHRWREAAAHSFFMFRAHLTETRYPREGLKFINYLHVNFLTHGHDPSGSHLFTSLWCSLQLEDTLFRLSKHVSCMLILFPLEKFPLPSF